MMTLVIILGSFFTSSETAEVAVDYAIFIYRDLNLRDIYRISSDPVSPRRS